MTGDGISASAVRLFFIAACLTCISCFSLTIGASCAVHHAPQCWRGQATVSVAGMNPAISLRLGTSCRSSSCSCAAVNCSAREMMFIERGARPPSLLVLECPWPGCLAAPCHVIAAHLSMIRTATSLFALLTALTGLLERDGLHAQHERGQPIITQTCPTCVPLWLSSTPSPEPCAALRSPATVTATNKGIVRGQPHLAGQMQWQRRSRRRGRL